jgi:hypothetical protein
MGVWDLTHNHALQEGADAVGVNTRLVNLLYTRVQLTPCDLAKKFRS